MASLQKLVEEFEEMGRVKINGLCMRDRLRLVAELRARGYILTTEYKRDDGGVIQVWLVRKGKEPRRGLLV